MNHWNYRVIEFVDPTTGEAWRAIHEVHYANDKPTSYSEAPASVTWDVPEDPTTTLDLMRQALEKPVLVERDFFST